MTRVAQRSPKLRRRSWADANFTFPARVFDLQNASHLDSGGIVSFDDVEYRPLT